MRGSPWMCTRSRSSPSWVRSLPGAVQASDKRSTEAAAPARGLGGAANGTPDSTAPVSATGQSSTG